LNMTMDDELQFEATKLRSGLLGVGAHRGMLVP
jgi:hypothetical protein